MKRLFAFALGVCLALASQAQPPQGFSYQAVVRDAEGKPLADQSIGVKISLQDEIGTTIYYAETHAVTTTTQGVITLTVGAGTSISGNFATIPWSAGGIYLRVEVDPTGGNTYALLGSTKLNAVPYALFAADGNQGPQGEPGPQGESGEAGADGTDGLSAYQIWLQTHTGTEEDFLASLKGETGEAGPQGDQGSDGLSAYQIWLQTHSGTEEDFLASLKGEAGEAGPQGDPGPQGDKGSDGLSAYQIWLQTHMGSEEDFMASLKGETGEQGPQGDPGPLVDGSVGQILIHDGTTWSASSNIYTNAGDSVGIGTTAPQEKLHVVGSIKATGSLIGQSIQIGDPMTDPDEPLFVVRNSSGLIVFAVYESGVRVYVDSDPDAGKSGSKGGFAIGGLSPSKDNGMEYFRVTPDSVRVYIDTTSSGGKGPSKGGFAIGGLCPSKGVGEEFLRVTRDSSRIYVNTDLGSKAGSKGGFAIGGLSPSKEFPEDLMYIGRDSARIYIDTDPTFTGKSGSKGGFAIGGLSPSKSGIEDYLRVTRDSTRVYIDDAAKGGFAVGGISTQGKTNAPQFLTLTPENYFIGHESGKSNTTGLYNSFIGYQAGTSNTIGLNNSFMGYQAGYSNTEGDGNLLLGYGSGYNNVTGDYNTFVGYMTGNQNNTGVKNTFMGSFSGNSNISGSNNTFIGFNTGYNNNSGESNNFIGTNSGFSNTSGMHNVFIGTESGYTNTNGNYNSFVGYHAGRLNKTGEYNVLLGYEAGLSNDSSYNAFIGYQAGRSNTKGINNIFVGYQSGFTNNLSSGNTYIGVGAGYGNDRNEGGNVMMGVYAGYNSNTYWDVYIGNFAGYNMNSTYGGNILVGALSGQYVTQNTGFNVFIGQASGQNATNPQHNTFIGFAAGQYNSGVYNNLIGARAGDQSSLNYSIAIGRWAARYAAGYYNTILGFNSGYYLTGQDNIAIGSWAGSNCYGDNNIFIGNYAGYTESGGNKLYIANGNTTSTQADALIYGEFDNKILAFNAKVGVGTIAPIAPLQINSAGDIPYLLLNTTATTNKRVRLQFGQNGTINWELATDASANNTDDLYFFNRSTSSFGPVIKNNGDVGIGTSIPEAKLHLNGNQNITSVIASNNNIGTSIEIRNSTITNKYQISLGGSANSVPGAFCIYDGLAGQARIFIHSNGDVGIGTTTPSQKLDVGGNIKAKYLYLDPQDELNEGGELLLIGAGSNSSLAIDNQAGNLRMHTFSSGKYLQLIGGTIRAEGTGGPNYFAGDMHLALGGTGYRVGIGTTNPQFKLEIVCIGDAIRLSRSGTSSYFDLGVGTNGDLIVNTQANTGAYCNGASWVNSSDRNLKENFEDVNGSEILSKINALNIQSWNYKGDNDEVKHIGPVAQEFYELFGLGNNDKSISTIDPAGISLAAIKELIFQNMQQQEQISKQQSEIDNLKAELDAIKALLMK